jgi:hypothetical protein
MRLVFKKPNEPQYEEVKNISSIMDVNPSAHVLGIMFMKQNGFVEFIEDSDEKTTYFVLTEKALNTLK